MYSKQSLYQYLLFNLNGLFYLLPSQVGGAVSIIAYNLSPVNEELQCVWLSIGESEYSSSISFIQELWLICSFLFTGLLGTANSQACRQSVHGDSNLSPKICVPICVRLWQICANGIRFRNVQKSNIQASNPEPGIYILSMLYCQATL